MNEEIVNSLRTVIKEELAPVHKRLDKIGATLEIHNERFDIIDERFNQIDERFGLVDERFNQIDKRFGLVDERFNQIDEQFGLVDERFDRIDEQFGLVDERFDRIDITLAGLKEQVAYNSEQIHEVKDEQLAVKQAILETNETVKKIQYTQVKHERTLDLLSRRSIDQEADLKRIM